MPLPNYTLMVPVAGNQLTRDVEKALKEMDAFMLYLRLSDGYEMVVDVWSVHGDMIRVQHEDQDFLVNSQLVAAYQIDEFLSLPLQFAP